MDKVISYKYTISARIIDNRHSAKNNFAGTVELKKSAKTENILNKKLKLIEN